MPAHVVPEEEKLLLMGWWYTEYDWKHYYNSNGRYQTLDEIIRRLEKRGHKFDHMSITPENEAWRHLYYLNPCPDH